MTKILDGIWSQHRRLRALFPGNSRLYFGAPSGTEFRVGVFFEGLGSAAGSQALELTLRSDGGWSENSYIEVLILPDRSVGYSLAGETILAGDPLIPYIEDVLDLRDQVLFAWVSSRGPRAPTAHRAHKTKAIKRIQELIPLPDPIDIRSLLDELESPQPEPSPGVNTSLRDHWLAAQVKNRK